MPIQLELDRAAGMARTTVEGTFSLSDMRRLIALYLDRKAYKFPGMVDARQAEGLALRARDLLAMAQLLKQGLSQWPMKPCAVVVSSDEHFAQARAFATFVSGWMRMGVFQDLAAAERWIAEATSQAAMSQPSGTHSSGQD